MSGIDSLFAWLWRRGAATPDPVAGLHLVADDAAELTEIGKRLEAEYHATAPAVISANLARLASRSVPVRAVRPTGVTGLAQVCFADGTVVFVRGTRPGDLSWLAVKSLLQPIRFEAFRREPRGVILDLAWPGDRVSVLAVGLDEAV